ncbi:hypothetical protein BDV93DRAFT_523690 [Ceratobasidium sp. AG-I]|nr:hypothetical protein BDV93DRAFT_523690 [Ceratobasidium sp. AG-I]
MKSQTIVDAQEHAIEAVTLYSQRAEVKRPITLELTAGRNDFAITNLPSSIVPDTFHVSGLSAAQASVVDTTCVIPVAKSTGLFGFKPQTHTKEALVKKSQAVSELEAEKNGLLRELSLVNAKNDVLHAYAKTLTGETTDGEDFIAFLTKFNEAGQESLEATTRINASIRKIEKRIEQVNKEDDTEDEDEDLSSKRKTKAGIVISAKEAGSVKLILTYVVSGARWSPAYELHASTDSTTQTVANTVTLHYRASVVQTTGENWDDVNLTLSTAPILVGNTLPVPVRSVVRELGSNQGLFSFGAPNVNAGAVQQRQQQPQQQQQQQQQGVFGQAATNNIASSSLFGQAQQAVQPNPQQGAFTDAFGFGSASSAQPASLFGSAASTTASSGLFGATAPPTTSGGFDNTDAGARPTGLFGAAISTTAPATTTGGLFGGGGGLFGQAVTEPHRHQLDDHVPEPQSPVIVASDPELQALEHAGTEAQERVFANTYRVDTPVTVQSDGTPHRVTIMTVQLAAKTEYVAVPKTMPTVFLQCRIENTSTHQLPPGPLVAYLDGSYVDKSNIPLVLPKGTITRSLGTDPAIRATFGHKSRKQDSEHVWAFSRQSLTVITDTIIIKNTRAAAVPRVLVRHGLPVPADERFTVNLKEPKGLAQLAPLTELKLRDKVTGRWWLEDGASGPNASGMMEWTVKDLEPDASEEIKFVYEISAPDGVKWIQT